jgi:capsular exopolysaccharide synthesis family protein
METHPSHQPALSASLGKAPQISQVPSSSPEESDTWDLGWLFDVLRRKALLILGIAVSTTLTSGVLIFLSSAVTKPKYEGSFQLLVEPATAEGKLSRSFLQAQTTDQALGNVQGNNLDQVATLDYETQIRILRSRKLLFPVVEQLQLRYPKITYESLIENLAIERLKITKDGKEQGTKLLEVNYTATDPQQVPFVLEQISQAYLRYSLKDRQSNIRQGIRFINDQLPQLQERVNRIQSRIAILRQQNNLMDPEYQGNEFTVLKTSLRRQQVETLAKLAESQARYKTLQEQLAGDNAIAVLSEFPSFQKLLERYHELESQIATTSARLNEDSPPMQALRGKQKNLQELLNQEAERILSRASDQVEVVQTQQQAIVQAETKLNQQFQLLPEVAREYAFLKQELKIASETLDRYLSKREALDIDAAQQEIPWEMPTPPTLSRDKQGQPINLAKKNTRLLIVLAAILATLFAVAIAFLIEILQDILYTPAETKRLGKLSLLGTIPNLDKSASLKLGPISLIRTSTAVSGFGRDLENSVLNNVFASSPQNFLSHHSSKTEFFTEAFNLLYSNLVFSGVQSHIRAIAISSAGSQEGKSTIAMYLAKAAAIAGKKVLLVDADLRSPQLHTYLELDNTKGLCDLIESDLDIHDVIQPSFVEPNLLVLTSGQVSSNPVRLLSSPKLKNLVQQFTSEFDLVIYDTPSINFADLTLLGSHVDGVALVARLGKTKRTNLTQAIEDLKISQLPILGIIANGSKNTIKSPSTSYSVSYGYSS